MKVSIIVPIYNVESYVEQCARSLFEQSFENVEFVFVNDASTDSTLSILEGILEEYPHQKLRTQIICNEVNRGVSASRNIGLKCATGHFVLFVDGDDWCSKDMVEELVIEQMERNCDVVTSSFFLVSPNKQRVVKSSPIGGRSGSLRVIVSQSFDLPNRVWGILMRRDMIEEFDIHFDRRITMGEDFLFLVQVLYHSHRIGHLTTPIYYYRSMVGTTSKISTVKRRSYIRAVAAARSFLKKQSDYKEFSGALRLSRFNLRRWLLLRQSRQWTPRSAIYRMWCYGLNSLYRVYCVTFKVR